MINIKINGQKKPIKVYSELTLKEYRDIVNAVKDKPSYNVFDYIAYLTGYKFEELMLQKVTNMKLLSDQLGEMLIVAGDEKLKGVKVIEQLPLKKFIVYDGKLIDLSRVDIKSKIGYRAVIEQYLQNKPNYMQLYAFTLATIIQERLRDNFDYASIEKITNKLDDYNAYHMLGNGAFFFRKLIHGERKGLNFLKMLIPTWIKTKVLKLEQV